MTIVHYRRPGGLTTACNITITADMHVTSRHRKVTCPQCKEKKQRWGSKVIIRNGR